MKLIIISVILVFTVSIAFSQDATEIVKKAYEKERGTSSLGEMTVSIIRPTWNRTIKIKTWGKGLDFSLTLITYPVKEKGQTFLKRKNELWSWSPTINRMVKLPPSMMSQGWMGSDYTNDDILKESSIVQDYTHKLLGSETLEGYDCYKIEMTPKESSNIVWGKVYKWISKSGYLQLKTEYYDEDGYKVKSDIGKNIKVLGGRTLPSMVEIIPEGEPGKKTVVEINSIQFDIKIEDSFFSQQNMQNIR
ncbi:MAG: outer membrane lipoprotein-sorting protein [Bacteroidales bacterium]